MGAKGTRQSGVGKVLMGGVVGLGVSLLVCLLASAGAFVSLERLVFDAFQRAFSDPAKASDEIVMVAMDQGSVEYFERTLDMPYPWPRSFYGEFIRFIQRGQPRGVIFDMLFLGGDIDRDEISGQESDQLLADAITESGLVVLGVSLRPADPTPPDPLSDELVAKMALTLSAEFGLSEFARIDPLAPPLVRANTRFGFVNAVVDDDGLVRRTRLLARVGDKVVPSLTLAAVLGASGQKPLSVSDAGIELDGRLIRLDEQGQVWIRFHGPGGGDPEGQGRTYPYIPIANLLRSAQQLSQGKKADVDPATFRDKWVIIGSTSTALFDQKATPFSSEGNYPGMEIHASLLDNLLAGNPLARVPGWMAWVLILLSGALVGSFSRLFKRTRYGLLTAFGVAAGAFTISLVAFLSGGWLVDVVSVQVAVLGGFVSVTYANFLHERRNRQHVRNIFQHYLDPRVVRGLIDVPDRLRLGGERRVCTAFFSDVVGFTSVAERMEPEQLVELMNRFLGSMTEAIIARGGFVDKYIGDAVMAVFGAPADLADHPRAACQAALDCHAQLEILSRALQSEGLPELIIRVGLNTGEMIVGNMGSAKRMNYTVMGDAVNLASRLEGVNKEFGTATLVGPTTRALVGDGMVFRELDRLRVKGKQESVCIFELLGPEGQVAAETHEKIELFGQGLGAYRKQAWQDALELFGKLDARWPGDGPTQIFLERCRDFRDTPPPGDWDGVYVMTRK